MGLPLIAQQSFDPFPMDVGAPFAMKQIRNSKLQEQVAHRRGIEYIGVKQSRVIAHGRG